MPRPQENTSQLQAWLSSAARGEPSGYDTLIAHASERLLRLTRRMLRDFPRLRRWEQTEDVFQQAALRLYRSLTDVKPDSVSGFFALAATQIRRTLLDLARHHFGPQGQAAHHHSEDNLFGDGRGLVDKPDLALQPESLEEWAQFHAAVGLLPDEARQVFEMVWYGGMEQSEIATLLAVSVPTVKRRWRSARLWLQKALSGQSPLAEEGR